LRYFQFSSFKFSTVVEIQVNGLENWLQSYI